MIEIKIEENEIKKNKFEKNEIEKNEIEENKIEENEIEENEIEKIKIEIMETDFDDITPIEKKHWIYNLILQINCIPEFYLSYYMQSPMDETNYITLAYNKFIPPHITIDPIPNICSLWGVIIFIMFTIYYIIWGVWVLFISIIYFILLFIPIIFITLYYICIVVRDN